MRAAVSIILATMVVTTPLKLVFAQAAEQEAATVRQTAPDSATNLIRVPPLTHKTSRLWRNPSGRALLNTELAGALLVQDQGRWDRRSTATTPLWSAGAASPETSTRDAIDWPPEDFLDYVVWGLAIAAFVGLVILIISIADESCGTELQDPDGLGPLPPVLVDTCN
jgi:hypothetical protein